jgi:hypothetical protein
MMSNPCDWEEASHFNSYAHYERVLSFINEQVATGVAKPVKVRKPYSGLETLNEHWYQCLASKQTWRLVAPDPPFKGIFEPV